MSKANTKKDGNYVKPHSTNVTARPKDNPKKKSVWYHPKGDDNGKVVGLYHPHSSTDAKTWADPDLLATFTPKGIPDGGVHSPAELNGVPFALWKDRPKTTKDWNAVSGQMPDLDEPPMPVVEKGKHLAAGVVIEESDGRIWTISPSNAFGGYENTFPKGTLEDGINPQASAIKEAFEESGLQVEITGFLADVQRSTSTTRYYRAKRVGGDPTDMGWESQAVHLVPRALLSTHLESKYDAPLVAALTKEHN